MSDLLDSNVWVALSAPEHVHHARALEYWNRQSAAEVAFNRITALALVRLLTQPAALGSAAMSGHGAWQALQRWLELPAVVWANEPEHLDLWLGTWSEAFDLRGRVWTDAYLAAFALAATWRFVTFDTGFRRFTGLNCLLLEG